MSGAPSSNGDVEVAAGRLAEVAHRTPVLRSRTLDERLRQLLVEEREDQMLRIHLRVALSQCLVHRRGHGFLRLECQLVEVHLAFLSGSVSLAR